MSNTLKTPKQRIHTGAVVLCLSFTVALAATLAAPAFPAYASSSLTTPPKVTGIASDESTMNSVLLKWRTSKDATNYRVYATSASKNKYKQVKTLSAKPVATAKFSGLKLETDYWFKIRPYYKTKSGTKYGSYGSKFSRRTVAFGSTSSGYITLQWNASKSASGYIVYRAGSKYGSYKKVKTVIPRVFCTVSKLKANTKYRFKVQAYRTNGKKKAYAKLSSRFTRRTANTKLSKVSGTAFADKTDTSLDLSWKKVSGASGYQVCVFTSSTGKHSQLKTLNGSTSTKVKLTGLEPNKRYWVKVRAFKKTKYCTTYGSYSKAISQRTLVLKQPSIKTLLGGDGYVLMTWNAISQASGYEVQRRSQLNTEWTTIQTSSGYNSILCEDTGARPGISTSYRVRSFNSEGYSPWSDVLSCTPGLKIPTIKSLSKTSLSWYSADYAEQYQIFKQSEGDSDWKLIGNTTSTSFNIPEEDQDENACFSVCAVNEYCKSRLADTTFSMKNMGGHSEFKALIEGDSVVSASSSFAKRAMRKLGLAWESRAKGGSVVSDTTSSETESIYRRSMQNGFEGYDLIIFRMSSNDYNASVSLGSIGSRDQKTLAGSYNLILERAREDAPNAKIVLCTPLPRGKFSNGKIVSSYSYKNSMGYTMNECRLLIYDLAEKYGCEVYDMRDSDVITASNLLTTTFDGAHPNLVSSIALGDEFESYLKDEILSDMDPSPCVDPEESDVDPDPEGSNPQA